MKTVSFTRMADAYFDATVRFCDKWDQPSFDPQYDTMPLSSFEPMVRRLFARDPQQHYDALK